MAHFPLVVKICWQCHCQRLCRGEDDPNSRGTYRQSHIRKLGKKRATKKREESEEKRRQTQRETEKRRHSRLARSQRTTSRWGRNCLSSPQWLEGGDGDSQKIPKGQGGGIIPGKNPIRLLYGFLVVYFNYSGSGVRPQFGWNRDLVLKCGDGESLMSLYNF